MTRLALALLLLSVCVAETTSRAHVAWFNRPLRASSPTTTASTRRWLCRPGRKDACSVDRTTTVVAADGKLTREDWKADPNAPIDCFYVYPTVSADPTPQQRHDGRSGGNERHPAAVRALARCAALCAALSPGDARRATRAMTGGGGLCIARSGPAYDDVRDAFDTTSSGTIAGAVLCSSAIRRVPTFCARSS